MANCPSCKSEVPAGALWCNICRSNILNPAIGKLASPGRRLGAYFMDLIIPAFALFVIILTFGGALAVSEKGKGIWASLLLLLSFALFAGYIIWALILFAQGTTPGKRILKMWVVKENGKNANFLTMLIREWIGKPISGLFFMIGYLWILFDQNNQGWHDKLVSTYVVERR